MAIYKTTSVQNVIRRVIKMTRMTDTSYLDDMLDWIPEAIEKLQTKYTLIPKSEDVEIRNNVGDQPCNLQVLTAITYCGYRLREGSTDVDLQNSPENEERNKNEDDFTLFVPDTGGSEHTSNGSYIELHRGQDLIPIDSAEHKSEFYKIVLDKIHTSFCKGTIKVYYKQLPVDCDGYPLIPNNENYKTALVWYILSMMVFTGYKLPDKRMDYVFCDSKFELYGRRAIDEIKYPSVDRMERYHRSLARMVFPQHFWEHYGINLEQTQEIKGI